jgi:hypothetical protein
MLNRLLPRQADNRFGGQPAALWLLGLLVALKLVVSGNSIFNTASVASGADGIPLDSFGPAAQREVLTLFALMALGQLILGLIALTALIRWRALVPFIYLLALGEQLARRLIVQTNDLTRPDSALVGWLGYVNYGILALLTLGLGLSLIPARQRRSTHSPG